MTTLVKFDLQKMNNISLMLMWLRSLDPAVWEFHRTVVPTVMGAEYSTVTGIYFIFEHDAIAFRLTLGL